MRHRRVGLGAKRDIRNGACGDAVWEKEDKSHKTAGRERERDEGKVESKRSG